MALFKKRQDEPLPDVSLPPISNETPTELVLNMRKQGMDNNSIIQSLQSRGYSSSQIFAALTQADQQSSTPQLSVPRQSPMPQQSLSQHNYQQQPQDTVQTLGVQQPQITTQPTQPQTQQLSMQQPQFGGMPEQPTQSQEQVLQPQPDQVSTEEVVEAIIDEKWNDLMKDIGKIVDWKNGVESRITRLEDSLKNMHQNFESLHTAIISRVGEYDKHLLNIHGQLKAFETVLSKFLPVFSENIQELSAAVQALKDMKKTSKLTKK